MAQDPATGTRGGWVSRMLDVWREQGACAVLQALAFRSWKSPLRGDCTSGVVFQYLDKAGGVAVVRGFVPEAFRRTRGSAGNAFFLVSRSSRQKIPLEPCSQFLFAREVTEGARFEVRLGALEYGDYHAAFEKPCGIALGPRFPLAFNYRNQWVRLAKDKALRMRRDGSFAVFRPTPARRAALEIGFLAELVAHRTLPEWIAAFTRVAFFFWRPFHRGRYWIFSDKLSNPIDSAYSVAKALVGNGAFDAERIVPYYLVDGRHSLRVKLPPKLKTVRYLSLRHRLLFLAAEASVTSEGGYAPFVPLAPYSDITAWQLRVSSLHGLVHHDLSAIYGRDFNNFNLMLTGVEREAEYERGGLWGYAGEDVVCTGLPRWDDRESEPGRKIYFVFTWRNNLVESSDPVTKERKYGALLENSEYKAKLQALLANPQLHDLAVKYGYSLEFLPHPLMRNAMSFFNFPDYVRIVPEDIPYEDIYRDASLAVTDYSSIAMDMAYLGKPVVYYQFDHDEFYATQGYAESFFSWKDDGFGPVVQDEGKVVDAISGILADGCVRGAEYERRAQAFFPRRDKDNGLRACRAVFDKIKRCNG